MMTERQTHKHAQIFVSGILCTHRDQLKSWSRRYMKPSIIGKLWATEVGNIEVVASWSRRRLNLSIASIAIKVVARSRRWMKLLIVAVVSWGHWHWSQGQLTPSSLESRSAWAVVIEAKVRWSHFHQSQVQLKLSSMKPISFEAVVIDAKVRWSHCH